MVAASAEYIDRALEESEWIHRVWDGREEDLCPVCRPDSPFDTVKRVREVVETADFATEESTFVYRLKAALDGSA